MNVDGYVECDCLLTDSEKVKECYRLDQDGWEHHDVTLADDLSVIHNQLLEEWRNAGFEVLSFGANRTDVDNLTASFKRAELKEADDD
jgi:hypothetical protein